MKTSGKNYSELEGKGEIGEKSVNGQHQETSLASNGKYTFRYLPPNSFR